jgi:quinol monooxygenase YgiN
MAKNEAVISAGKGVTFVNIIEVTPDNQAKLIEVLNEGVEKVIRHKDGFISASILASKDGTSVINIAQWESPANVAAVREDPAAQEYAKKTAAIAKAVPNLYSVVSVHA